MEGWLMEDIKQHGLLYIISVAVLAVSGIDLGKTDSITKQLSSMDTRLTVIEYRVSELEEAQGGNNGN